MQILRKMIFFGPSLEDMTMIYNSYIRSILEQSSVVWGSSLTQENIADLERVQKCAAKIILQDKYENYNNAINILGWQKLTERRKLLVLKFAKNCLKNEKMQHLFPKNEKSHKMRTRYNEKYRVLHANTERLKSSTIPYLQNILNNEEKSKKCSQ